MGKKLYVGNLLYEVTDEDLKNLFTPAGNVVSAVVIKFRDTGRSKGFGFVEMETEEAAQKAIDTLNGQDNQGRKLVVSEARPPKPRTSFGGGEGM
jgi:cold-inducible RNA-binding protein